MTFAQVVADLQNFHVPIFVEIHDKKAIWMYRDDSGLHLMMNVRDLSQQAKDYLISLDSGSFMLKLQHIINCELFGAGPKVFRPTSEQMFALERMKLNLSWQDFATPYKCIVIELPEEYAKARGSGGCSVLYFDPKIPTFVHGQLYNNRTSYQTWWAPGKEADIETWFDETNARDLSENLGDLPLDADEKARELLIRRATLNYCLLLDEVGIKSNGPATPNQYNQLVKWCSKQNKHTHKNKMQLQAQPMLFSLKAPTKLVRVVSSPSELPEAETGRVVSPHSRRGHYRMNPCGPNGSQRKRVRIPPTFVNKHLLFGPNPGSSYST